MSTGERQICISPKAKPPKSSWWADCPTREAFYQAASREADRMRVTETSTAQFQAPVGSKTPKKANPEDLDDAVEDAA